MPPPGARRPDNATYDRVATWLETELDRAAAIHVNPGRPAEFHRLNRVEYGNAVRDLLGVDIDPKAMLPADEQAHGFSTNADALSMQPALLNSYTRKYFLSADKKFRLTIDREQVYYRISYNHNTFLNKVSNPQAVVLELKYEMSLDEEANEISKSFPFAMTKNSKYLQGIERVLF